MFMPLRAASLLINPSATGALHGITGAVLYPRRRESLSFGWAQSLENAKAMLLESSISNLTG